MTNTHTGNVDVEAIEARANAAWNAQPETALIAEILRLEAREKVLRVALTGLLSYAERNHCEHPETHRGGGIWEICDSCGAKWADDRGGKPTYKEPIEFTVARAALSTGEK